MQEIGGGERERLLLVLLLLEVGEEIEVGIIKVRDGGGGVEEVLEVVP